MNTQCSDRQLTLQGIDKRKIVIKNDASVNSSDGGLLLLGKLEQRFDIIRRLAQCFADTSNQQCFIDFRPESPN